MITSNKSLVNELKREDEYDLVIVLVRKKKLLPVLEILAASPGVKKVLFKGNNALGFDEHVKRFPVEKVLFGFPSAGGGIREQVVHYAARDEMEDLACEFQELTARTSVDTPNIDTLRNFII